jgi:hypothetical protein
MNERIRELAVQCGAWKQVYNPHQFIVDRTFNVEKFAELIVRECLSQVDKIRDGLEADGEDQQALGAEWVGLAIARHLGVEE